MHQKDLGANAYLYLNESNSVATSNYVFNNTAPTDSVITNYASNSNHLNEGRDMIYYCFHSVPSFSQVGVYEGTGSTNGPFIQCGFRPAFLLVKNISGSFNWFIADSERSTSNPIDELLYPNDSSTETTSGSSDNITFNSNGFKIEATGNTVNQSGSTFIYYAVAETPFKYALAR